MNTTYKLPHDEEIKVLEIKLTPTAINNEPCLVILLRDTTEHDQITKLKELDKYRNSLLNTVSHELRTPVNAIILLLQ